MLVGRVYLLSQIRCPKLAIAAIAKSIQIEVRVNRNVILHLHLLRVATQADTRPFLGRLQQFNIKLENQYPC